MTVCGRWADVWRQHRVACCRRRSLAGTCSWCATPGGWDSSPRPTPPLLPSDFAAVTRQQCATINACVCMYIHNTLHMCSCNACTCITVDSARQRLGCLRHGTVRIARDALTACGRSISTCMPWSGPMCDTCWKSMGAEMSRDRRSLLLSTHNTVTAITRRHTRTVCQITCRCAARCTYMRTGANFDNEQSCSTLYPKRISFALCVRVKSDDARKICS